ncbi:MAG TPA: DUF378 domain-containing protein [Elusimicrobiales bacterium]|nr:DUF378 domain-containing protein [Elusimicrobiales bacterium]
MKSVRLIALWLVVIGGLNWGLVGLFGFDLVAALLGNMTMLARIVYVLVGVSAIYMLTMLGKLSQK